MSHSLLYYISSHRQQLLFFNDFQYYEQEGPDNQVRHAARIRLTIFLITGVCVGLPAHAWALRFLYRGYKSGGRVSALVIMLLLCDLLVLCLNPYMVTIMIQDDNCGERFSDCWILSSLWSGSLFCALHLQPVMVLEAAIFLRHPLCSAHVFFPSFSITISIIVFILFFLCELFDVPFFIILGLPLSVILIVISCIVTCKAPPNMTNIPYRTLKPSRSVLAFSIFTVVLFVTVTGSFIWMNRLDGTVLVIFFCLMSLRVITDPLLCVLANRKDFWVQIPAEPKTNIELDQV